jgi:hypothetical protein
MNRRYLVLFLGILGTAALLAAFGRAPRGAAEALPPVLAAPIAELAITIEHGEVRPALARVAKDHEIHLTVENLDARRLHLELAGYEDRVALDLDPHARVETRFLADRPGEGFPWIADGRPAGRLNVTGSHLVEGHR